MTKNINLNLNNHDLIDITKNKPTFNDKSVIVSKNKFLSKDNPQKTCNCRNSNKPNCSLRGNCLTSNVVYKVEVESKCRNRFYIGSTGVLSRIDTPGINTLLLILITNKTPVYEIMFESIFKGMGKCQRWFVL